MRHLDMSHGSGGPPEEGFDGDGVVSARFVRGDERPYPSADTDVPLVLEARRDAGINAVRGWLSRRSEAIISAIHRHGAVLLRAIPVTSTREFEETLFSIHALRAMRGYFMAEPGRVRMAGSDRIFHTNALVRTGGNLDLGGFHSENYYSTDVPEFVVFCCLTAPWMGGETGLVHMARAYQELGAAL